MLIRIGVTLPAAAKSGVQAASRMAAIAVRALRIFISFILEELHLGRDAVEVELLALLIGERGCQRQVRALVSDSLLSLPAQDVAQELLHLRIDARIRDLGLLVVDRVVDVDRPRERITAVGDALRGRRDERARTGLAD